MIRALSVVLFMGSITASALPMPKADRAIHIPPTLTANYDFEGIVALDDCSGSLIQFENAKDSDPALVLTNGHCLETGMPNAGEVIVNQPSSRDITLYDSANNQAATISATKVLYSTMTNTDITLYQTDKTYAEIKSAYNIAPFTLSSQHPAVGTAINVVSGYWDKGYTCSIAAFVYEVKEDQWTWKDSVRYSEPGCEVIGGTSGSPVIQAGTRTIVAINNTINEAGGQCTLDNPCEVGSNGAVTYQKGNGYAEETYLIYSCLNSNHQFDLSVSGCLLPKPE